MQRNIVFVFEFIFSKRIFHSYLTILELAQLTILLIYLFLNSFNICEWVMLTFPSASLCLFVYSCSVFLTAAPNKNNIIKTTTSINIKALRGKAHFPQKFVNKSVFTQRAFFVFIRLYFPLFR